VKRERERERERENAGENRARERNKNAKRQNYPYHINKKFHMKWYKGGTSTYVCLCITTHTYM
jgi:hypothetical protein